MHLPIVLAADAFVIVVVALLFYVAWYDYRSYTIPNKINLILLGLYLVWALLTGFASLKGDVAAAVILFLPGFVLWLLKMMGAGDVKLYFVLGLFIGMQGLGLFAVSLLLVTLIFLIAIRLACYSTTKDGILARLKQIKQSGKAPYAVIMCGAAIPVILVRAFA